MRDTVADHLSTEPLGEALHGLPTAHTQTDTGSRQAGREGGVPSMLNTAGSLDVVVVAPSTPYLAHTTPGLPR